MGHSVVITMAGRGARFRSAGFDVPKYEITAHGRSLFEWALLSLRNFFGPQARVIFVCLGENGSAPFVLEQCRKLGIGDAHVLQLDALTDGQATSAYLARSLWRDDEPLLIYNIDTHVRPGALRPDAIPADADGWIPCVQLPGDHWSFVRLGADGWAVEVKEKVRISPYASVGLYWFGRAAAYTAAYEDFFSRPDSLVRGERYVAPLYSALIQAGRRVAITDLAPRDVRILGTPEELEAFRAAPAGVAAGAEDI
ncbi:MAG TPA: glycosyltransferase family 2 protein [Ramlibacter sp.]|nr:glycosyltransferase family 2 protein [Ramlibacter sp.]